MYEGVIALWEYCGKCVADFDGSAYPDIFEAQSWGDLMSPDNPYGHALKWRRLEIKKGNSSFDIRFVNKVMGRALSTDRMDIVNSKDDLLQHSEDGPDDFFLPAIENVD